MKIGFVQLGAGGLIPTVPIEVKGETEAPKTVNALLDSGFTGAVSLPLRVVEDLKLKWSGEHSVTLADASEVSVDLYEGIVDFAGGQYRCAILSTGDVPTVGIHLMQEARICFEAVPGCDGSLEPLNS